MLGTCNPRSWRKNLLEVWKQEVRIYTFRRPEKIEEKKTRISGESMTNDELVLKGDGIEAQIRRV
jgi:hypothetical protein